jgi:hypothetical protein
MALELSREDAMSGDSQQWAALASQNERLVGVSRQQPCADVPDSGRKPWRRRVAEAAQRADEPSQPARSTRHSRRRAARPQA